MTEMKEIVVTIDNVEQTIYFPKRHYDNLASSRLSFYLEYINSQELKQGVLDICSVDTIPPKDDLNPRKLEAEEERPQIERMMDENIAVGLVVTRVGNPLYDDVDDHSMQWICYLPEGSNVVSVLEFDGNVIAFWDENSACADVQLFEFIKDHHHLTENQFYKAMREVLEILSI